MAAATWSRPAARATSMPRWIEWIQAAAAVGHDDAGGAEDREPADDARAARSGSSSASASPPGIDDRDRDVAAAGRPRPRPRRRRIIRRGTGLIAGSPGGELQPWPGHRADALAGVERDAGCRAALRRTVARTRQPWVTSGSSPASLTTPAVARRPAEPRSRPARSSALPPRGSRIVHRVGKALAKQRRGSRLGRRRGAGARGPAAAQAVARDPPSFADCRRTAARIERVTMRIVHDRILASRQGR